MTHYETYIASPFWAAKRKHRLALDGNRCRLCDEDGSQHRLEVHHRPSSYAKIPHESVQDDLVTLCIRCHKLITSAIRSDRYSKRQLPEVTSISQIHRKENEKAHGMASNTLSVDFIGATNNAQRSNGRSSQQMVKSFENDFVKARQNRR